MLDNPIPQSPPAKGTDKVQIKGESLFGVGANLNERGVWGDPIDWKDVCSAGPGPGGGCGASTKIKA